MKVAVTGATGFVGSHVVPNLLARGARVTVATRNPDRVHAVNSRLTTVHLDIDDSEDAFARLGKPDVLLHLAWRGLPNYRSETHLKNELPRQIAFLEACSHAGLQRLVVTGTCLEYGMQCGCLDESMPTSPTTDYGLAKDHLRVYLQDRVKTGGPRLTWLRLFYIYGVGQSPTSLYSQLCAAVDAGTEEFPMSPGDQQRDFLPVESAAAHIAALTLGEPAGIVNVCSGTPRTVVSMVREWSQKRNVDLRLKLGAYPYPDYEPLAFWGSTRKLDALLGAS